MDEPLNKSPDKEDLTREAVDAAKKKTRINALVLAAVFLLSALAPYPWNAYAPLLILIPLVYSVVNRVKKNGSLREPQALGSNQEGVEAFREPYGSEPRDPKDPRRYKPIG